MASIDKIYTECSHLLLSSTDFLVFSSLQAEQWVAGEKWINLPPIIIFPSNDFRRKRVLSSKSGVESVSKVPLSRPTGVVIWQQQMKTDSLVPSRYLCLFFLVESVLVLKGALFAQVDWRLSGFESSWRILVRLIRNGFILFVITQRKGCLFCGRTEQEKTLKGLIWLKVDICTNVGLFYMIFARR